MLYSFYQNQGRDIMKKTAVILCLILCLSILCACMSSNNQAEEVSTTEITTTEDPTIRVTFPEGFTAVQIAEKLEENKEEELKKLLRKKLKNLELIFHTLLV